MSKTVVIGVIFVDIKGFPFQKYKPVGTNKGLVKFVQGGVSRNVAEDLSHLNIPVSFVTLTDYTPIGKEAHERLLAQGIDLTHAIVVPENGVGVWLAVMDETRDLAGSISQMPDTGVLEEYLSSHGDEIVREADQVLIEFDIGEKSAELVTDLAKKYHKDLFCINANMTVVLKRLDLLRETRCFICNSIEAEQILRVPLSGKDPEQILETVLHAGQTFGFRSMVVTLGSSGSVYYDAVTGESGFCPAETVTMVDSTGAGDAFFSGIVACLQHGYSLTESVKKSTHLSALTIQSVEACCPVLDDFWDDGNDSIL